jgi:hypothetical protein
MKPRYSKIRIPQYCPPKYMVMKHLKKIKNIMERMAAL